MKPVLIAINSSYSHTNLAVRYLSKAAGCPYYETNENLDPDLILKNIMEQTADTLLFSCYIWNIELILRLTSSIKKINPSMRIVLGGPEVSFDAKDIMQSHPQIDYILCGEGEELLPQFLEHLKNGKQPALPGVVYRDDKIVIGDDRYQIVADLDTLPFPYDNFPQHRIIYYEMSRGCPFSCTYCLSGACGGGVRRLSMDRIKSDLRKLKQADVKVIKLVDRTFNANKAFVKEIIPFILEETGDVRFHFEIGADLLDEELLTIFMQAPVNKFQLEAGIQSCNPNTLELIRRKTDLAVLTSNITALLQANNMHIHLDLIAGLPGESFSSFADSFNFVYALKPHMLQLGFLKLIKGSELRSTAGQHGIVYRDEPPYEVLYTDDISFEELNTMKQIEALVDRYYNSGRCLRALSFLEESFSSPFELYLSFSRFLGKDGQRPMSAAHQLDALIDFAREHCQDLHHFLCLLKLDYYASGAKGNLPKGFLDIEVVYSKKDIRRKYDLDKDAKFDLIPLDPNAPSLVVIGPECDPISGQRILHI